MAKFKLAYDPNTVPLAVPLDVAAQLLGWPPPEHENGPGHRRPGPSPSGG